MSRKYKEAWKEAGGVKPPPLFLHGTKAGDRTSLNDSCDWQTKPMTHSQELIMNGNAPQEPSRPDHAEEDPVDRHPDEADEDQLDEALEETFPASDPISP